MFTAVLAVVVVTGAVVAVVVGGGSGSPAGRATGPAHSGRPAAHRADRADRKVLPATAPGSDGVVARWVVAENARPGTTAWKIPPTTPAGIDGFAGLNYAAPGDTVPLYVSTTAPTFRVVAYRMGWYQGKGAREIWSSPVVAGRQQPACPLTPGVNMVSCDNWTPSLSLKVTAAFVQGDYLLKLVGSGGQEAYVPLTVWDPTSRSAYLVINRTFVEEAWNAYGGYSFYQGEGPCPAGSDVYPVCNRARVASFDRPYDTGNGASDFLSNEYPLIEYSEEHGLDVTYVTDVTLDADPALALQHKAILSLGHDEAWSYNERQAVQTAESHGVNVVFFGAAAVLRHVRLQASPLGPDREEVDYRDASEDPLDGHGNPLLVTGNTWSSPPTNWSEVPFVGESYSGYLSGTDSVPFVVFDSSAWIFQRTGLVDGSQLPGVIMSDVDHLSPTGSPADLEVLGHSPIPTSLIYTNEGTWGKDSYSDMTYYTDPASKAGVLDTGTVSWIYAMTPCAPKVACAAPAVQKITGNLLRVFGAGPAGLSEPSVGNTATVKPAGS